MNERAPTVGVLYPGEMGASLCALLRQRGTTVVTTLQGRSDDTVARAAGCGVHVLDSLAHVVRRADVMISTVVPSAAEEVAQAYCDLAGLAPRDALYVDANSIGPDKAAAIAKRLDGAGLSFVDAAINGLAVNLGSSGTLYLSGRRAPDVACLFEETVRVCVLGDQPGRASAMKMLLGGLSKGVCALFTELGLLAQRQGMLDEMLAATSRTYPGVFSIVERMLCTYPRHAARRQTEMSELDATARAAGITPCMIEAVRQMHVEFARAWPAGAPGSAGLESARVKAVIEEFADSLQSTEAI